MSSTAVPSKTQAARQLLAGPRSLLTVPMRMLLINVDGRRNVVELQDIARGLNLSDQALAELQREGLISGVIGAARASGFGEQAPPEIKSAAASSSRTAEDDLRRLMRAKMFAFDLACRMLAGRDADLRASAREVNSESRFLDWLADASARIEAASDCERAQLFRDRVAQAGA